MNTVISRLLETFVRVLAFGAERKDSFPADTLGGEQLKIIAEVVEALNGAITAQTSGKSSVQQATSSRTGAREALRESMQAISRTARVMALDIPGLENKFRMPRSGSDQALLPAARAFATDAEPLKDEFIRHELSASFIEDLKSDIANLERAMGVQNTGRGAQVAATASIEPTVERGMAALRRLNAIVRNKFRDDPATLAAWEHARHIERPARQPKRNNGGTNSPAPGTREHES